MDLTNNLSRKNKYSMFSGQPNDNQLLAIIEDFSTSLDVMENDLTFAIKAHNCPTLTTEEQIKLDIFFSYVNSTLFWMYLKLQGSDIKKNYILHDLGRAKELIAREKQIPSSLSAYRLDLAATKRFIAAGMHTRFVDMDGVMVTEAQYKRSLGDAEIKELANEKSSN